MNSDTGTFKQPQLFYVRSVPARLESGEAEKLLILDHIQRITKAIEEMKNSPTFKPQAE